MSLRCIVTCSTLLLAASGLVIEKRAGCQSYTLINTRGTVEPQDISVAFKQMNPDIMGRVPGGKNYNTVYDAPLLQISKPGTEDIIKQVKSTLQKNPDECFILQGYSQGATATVDALPKLKDKEYDAVKGVFLFGNTRRTPGLSCNVDIEGGKSTVNSVGILHFGNNGIPDQWVSKTMDVCNSGDGVCDKKNGLGITPQHLQYQKSPGAQKMGADFAVKQLQG